MYLVTEQGAEFLSASLLVNLHILSITHWTSCRISASLFGSADLSVIDLTAEFLPEKENLVQPLVDSDTSKEQEATNVSLTRSEDENAVSEDEIHAESTLNSAQTWNKRKTPYSIKFNELPEALRKFLASVKKFFTQKVNFEREKAPVTLSTYEKAQERMLCKYLIRSFFL